MVSFSCVARWVGRPRRGQQAEERTDMLVDEHNGNVGSFCKLLERSFNRRRWCFWFMANPGGVRQLLPSLSLSVHLRRNRGRRTGGDDDKVLLSLGVNVACPREEEPGDGVLDYSVSLDVPFSLPPSWRPSTDGAFEI